jgi:hypothetical protein
MFNQAKLQAVAGIPGFMPGYFPTFPPMWPNRAVRRAVKQNRHSRLPQCWREALAVTPGLGAAIRGM